MEEIEVKPEISEKSFLENYRGYHIGPLRNNFSNLDIFAVDDTWNVHI